MDQQSPIIATTLKALQATDTGVFSALVGLDGYIDKIQRPVKQQNKEGKTFFSTLSQFGEKIVMAANKSAQIELHTQQVKLGGNAPIMSNALATLGIPNACLGTFGYPDIDPLFHTMHPDCQLISVGSAAGTNALEFNDGKLMLSDVQTFSELDWETVKKRVDFKDLKRKTDQVALVALVDWCNLPQGNDVWKGILTDLISARKDTSLQFFFDLADPSKKEVGELQKALEIIGEFRPHGGVTLGLNENEAHILLDILGKANAQEPLEQSGRYIFGMLNVDRLVIHPVDRALVFEADASYQVMGRLVEKPLVTTGGGDNFNAGFMFGLLHGFPITGCMVLGIATSGSYVENGSSPSQGDLANYLIQWKNELQTSET